MHFQARLSSGCIFFIGLAPIVVNLFVVLIFPEWGDSFFGFQSLLCSLRSRRTLFAAGLRPCLRVHILHFPLLYNAVSGCAASLTLCGSNCCNNFTVPLPYFPSSLVFTSTYIYPFLVPCRSSAAHHLRDRYVGALSAYLSITGKHRYIPPAYLTLTADI